MYTKKMYMLLISSLFVFAFDAAAVGSPIIYRSKNPSIDLTVVGTYRTEIYNDNAAEISAYDPQTRRLFVTNDAQDTLDVLDISKPTEPTLLFQIDVSNVTPTLPTNSHILLGSPNSVAVSKGLVAVTIEARDVDDENTKTNRGAVGIFNANIPAAQDTTGLLTLDDIAVEIVQVGAMPDMVTFTPDGQKILVANEGEPNEKYTIDPEGSISIIKAPRGTTKATVINVGFQSFNSQKKSLKTQGVRIYGPGSSVAQDLEPEFITVSNNNSSAWVTLQENNALAIIDIKAGKIREILPLGVKNYNAHRGDDCPPGEDRPPCDGSKGNMLDASNEDDTINIRNWPLFGMFQPDAIASYQAMDGRTYLVTANEGDARDYAGLSETVRVKDLRLEEKVFPEAKTLQKDQNLGRLQVTNQEGITDPKCLEKNAQAVCEYKALFAFGARSFSIWSSHGQLVFDSGDDFEQIIATALSEDRYNANATNSKFNANHDANNFDNRSDDKGPEPEGVTVGTIDGRSYAFIVLERDSGMMVYDITDPNDPYFELYINNRSFSVEPDEVCNKSNGGDPKSAECKAVGDLGPESVLFIPKAESPDSPNPNKPGNIDQAPLLSVTNEISGTTTLYRIDRVLR